MTADRALCDRDDAKSFGARERRQHAALGDAEHRPIRSFAADMQTWIAVACDDEGRRAVVALDEPAQRHRHTLDIGLTLDSVWPLGQRLADNLRSALKAERLQ